MGGRLTRTAATTTILAGAALTASLAAWALLAGRSPVHAHGASISIAAFWWAVVMWQGMMVAMMTPTVAPWVAAYGRVVSNGSEAGALGASLAFAGGYFSIWLAYSAAAATLQMALTAAGWLGHGDPPRLLAAGVLVAAGGFQFAPIKRACLTHCRNPLSYLLAHWRGGPPGAFRLGLTHGAYCVGCCWLLMLTGFAVGLMNLAWMALLTLVVAAEQAAPGGAWLGRLAGAGLVAWGAALAWPA